MPAPVKPAPSYPLARIILYVKDMPRVANFYQTHFGLRPRPSDRADWLELESEGGRCTIALHQAARTQKSGAAVKLVFAVADVRSFVADRARAGLIFGPIHAAPGFAFANAKDPAGNSISVSNRGLE
jgi:predicted enzyme related to lactoylglutathione lyase